MKKAKKNISDLEKELCLLYSAKEMRKSFLVVLRDSIKAFRVKVKHFKSVKGGNPEPYQQGIIILQGRIIILKVELSKILNNINKNELLLDDLRRIEREKKLSA